MTQIGDVVFTNGNEAAIVIHVKDDGDVVVGHFSGASEIRQGNFGSIPSLAPEHDVDYMPENAPAVVPQAGEPVIPVASAPVGQPTPEPEPAAQNPAQAIPVQAG